MLNSKHWERLNERAAVWSLQVQVYDTGFRVPFAHAPVQEFGHMLMRSITNTIQSREDKFICTCFDVCVCICVSV